MDLKRHRANLPVANGAHFFPGAAAVTGFVGTTSVALNERSAAMFAAGVATFAIIAASLLTRPDRLGVTFATSAICSVAAFASYSWGPALIPAIVLWGAGWRVQERQPRWAVVLAAVAGLAVGLFLAVLVDFVRVK